MRSRARGRTGGQHEGAGCLRSDTAGAAQPCCRLTPTATVEPAEERGTRGWDEEQAWEDGTQGRGRSSQVRDKGGGGQKKGAGERGMGTTGRMVGGESML